MILNLLQTITCFYISRESKYGVKEKIIKTWVCAFNQSIKFPEHDGEKLRTFENTTRRLNFLSHS